MGGDVWLYQDTCFGSPSECSSIEEWLALAPTGKWYYKEFIFAEYTLFDMCILVLTGV